MGIYRGELSPAGEGERVLNAADLYASVVSAQASADAAATSESNASASATAAANEASAAYNSSVAAATSEANAADSASAAATSATAAAASAASAATHEANTQALFDSFDTRYLGAYASDPTLDNQGNPLVAGAMYFNTVVGRMQTYTGSAWDGSYAINTDYVSKTDPNAQVLAGELHLDEGAGHKSVFNHNGFFGQRADGAMYLANVLAGPMYLGSNGVYDQMTVETDGGVRLRNKAIPTLDDELVRKDYTDGLTDREYVAKRVFVTTNNNTAANQYTKVASIEITAQYGWCDLSLLVLENNGSGAGKVSITPVNVRVKQQNAFGSNPYVEVSVGARPWQAETINQYGYVIEQNTPTTIVSLYVQQVTTYADTRGSVLAYSMSNSTVTWLSSQTLSGTQPTNYVKGSSGIAINHGDGYSVFLGGNNLNFNRADNAAYILNTASGGALAFGVNALTDTFVLSGSGQSQLKGGNPFHAIVTNSNNNDGAKWDLGVYGADGDMWIRPWNAAKTATLYTFKLKKDGHLELPVQATAGVQAVRFNELTTANNIGSAAYMKQTNSGTYSAGSTNSGANLTFASLSTTGVTSSGVGAGTWRCMGYSVQNYCSVWVRIA